MSKAFSIKQRHVQPIELSSIAHQSGQERHPVVGGRCARGSAEHHRGEELKDHVLPFMEGVQ
jgi:hypothetical protein